MDDEQITLRDQITANVDEAVETPEVVEEIQEVAAPEGETAEQKEQRLRDERGRFAKAEQVESAEIPIHEVKKINRPSTWKKDYWEHFDKLATENPQLAEYINQRESEYAKGVSTYKNEAERAKAIWGALEPFMPELQQHQIDPAQWVGNLGRAHQQLAKGNPQQKLQMFQKLAQDYGVPLQALVQQDGQQDPVLQYVSPLYEQVNQLKGQLHSWQTQQQQAEQRQIQGQIEKFAEGRPYFEQVRETMSGLLQSGLAQDLESAYEAAVRLPQHDSIFQELQQQQKLEAEKRAAEQRAVVATRARNQAVSTRSTTPTGPRSKSNGSGLRETLAEAFESASTGRV